ncbi:PfkB family carbohydrate kinase [Escherichia coli]
MVDTTGAGDVFHGALAVALATGGDLAESVRFASGVAALKCTRPGGRPGSLTVIKPDLFCHFLYKMPG